MSSKRRKIKNATIEAGSLEILYRMNGAPPLEEGEEPDMIHYELACRPMGISEFDDPFAVLEWLFDRPPVVKGRQLRGIRPHDMLNIVPLNHQYGVTLMVADLDRDMSHVYEGCRVQGDQASLCPYVLIPLKTFAGSIKSL